MMRTWTVRSLAALLSLSLLLLAAPAFAGDDAPAGDRDAEWSAWKAMFAQRSTGLRAHKKAMVELRRLADAYESDYEIQWMCSRAFYYFSERYQKEQDDLIRAVKMSKVGEMCGRRTMRADPDGFDGRYWKLSNAVRVLAGEGKARALRQAQSFKKVMEQLIADHPTRQEGFMALGAMYRVLPGFPVSFGDTAKGLELLLKGVEVGTAQVEILIEVAEAYAALGDKPKAIEWYRKVDTAPGYPEMDFEREDARIYAKKRIEELSGE